MNCCPVTIRGELYPSQKAAADALGLVPSAIAQSLLRNGHCDNVGIGNARAGNTNAPSRPVRIGNLQFRSQLGAAKALGVHRSLVRRFILGELKQAGKERLLRAAMTYKAREARHG